MANKKSKQSNHISGMPLIFLTASSSIATADLGNPFLSHFEFMFYGKQSKLIFRETLLTVQTTCEYETCVIHTTCGWYPPIYQHIQRLAKYQRTTTRILIGVEKPNLQNWILCHFMWIVCYLRRDL